ncbi:MULTISPECIES: hypothetical protein [unclassified Helicobacter]|uniref:hypothetical protein n=1 Tax=unclassified Helicobacter TaxID=2593540 RepID=UPI000CF110A7|nr:MULTISPECIES: hypothetical protein [unclassified Helicobacter]
MKIFERLFLYIRLWFVLSQRTSRKLDLVDFFFVLISILSIALLAFMISEISISDKEARNLFYNKHIFFGFLNFLNSYFEQSDYIVKAPLLILHFFNLMLLYGICRHTLKHKSHSLICILIYTALPGVNLSALLLFESSWIIFFTFLVGYIYTRYKKTPWFLLFVLSFSIPDVIILFLGIAVFMLKNKNFKGFAFSLLCLGLNICISNFNISGRPQAYFLETLAQIAVLYSPLLFIYYVYSIYWGIIHKNNPLSYIAGTGIVFCIILSLRQNINFYTLVPQSLIALPIMAQCFLNDLKIRLPQFRKQHYFSASIVILFLILQTGFIFGNKVTYFFSNKPNFASSYYFAKEIATQLKRLDITAIRTQSISLRLQLRYYGIKDNQNLLLISTKDKKSADIIVSYNNTPIYLFKIQKAPNAKSF